MSPAIIVSFKTTIEMSHRILSSSKSRWISFFGLLFQYPFAPGHSIER